MATMIPANICSGFRKCGIYPYNPDAIDCSISTNNPAEWKGNHTRNNEMKMETAANQERSPMTNPIHFLPSLLRKISYFS